MRCSLGTIVAAALVVATSAAPAFAQERSIWALVINDEPKGDIEILLTADGPWVDPAVLVAAGVLKVPDGRRQVFAPDTISRVSLASLAPQITFTLDEAEIRLIISADPALLSATELAISNPRPPGWKVSSNNAIFLNYSANWSTDDKTTGYGELGVHLFGALFETAASVDDTGAVTPGLTSLTFDQVRGRRRWVLGDTIGRSTTLGSSPVVGGFSLSTQAGSRSVLRHLSCAADQGRRAHAVDGGRVRRRPPRLVGAVAARTIYAERSADRNRPRQRSRDHSRCLRPPAVDRPWLLPLDAVVETR